MVSRFYAGVQDAVVTPSWSCGTFLRLHHRTFISSRLLKIYCTKQTFANISLQAFFIFMALILDGYFETSTRYIYCSPKNKTGTSHLQLYDCPQTTLHAINLLLDHIQQIQPVSRDAMLRWKTAPVRKPFMSRMHRAAITKS